MPYVLRDPFRFAKWMNKAMTAFAIGCLLYFIVPIVFAFLIRGDVEVFWIYKGIHIFIPLAMLGALVTYFAFFFMWLHQAVNNLWAMHLPALNYKPGQAVMWFFIPLANIVMPYFILSEVLRASDPVSDIPGRKLPWNMNPAPANMLMWWFSLLLCFFGLFYRVLNWWSTGEPVESVRLVIAMIFLGFVFFLLNYLVTIAGNVSENQIRKYENIIKAREAIKAAELDIKLKEKPGQVEPPLS